MTPDPNPYESPRTDIKPPDLLPADVPRLWRQGDWLVMHRATLFPKRCVMTGESADDVYPWNVANWTSRITVHVPLSKEYVQSYRTFGFILWGLWLVAVVVAFIWPTRYWRVNSVEPWGPALLGGGATLLAAFLHWQLMEPVRLGDVWEPYIWLKGVHPRFLEELPEWPYGMPG